MTSLRVAILGAASSGKSTLAAALARHLDGAWVPEYLREFVDVRGRVPAAADQFHIASTQRAREDAAAGAGAGAGGYVFCDTAPLMTAIYSGHYFGAVDAALARLAASHAADYALTVVTAADIAWVADGLQRESEQVSVIVNGLLMAELAARRIPYLLASGDVAQRVEQVALRLAGGCMGIHARPAR